MKSWVYLPAIAMTLVVGACGVSTVNGYYGDISAEAGSVTVSPALTASVGHSVKGTPVKNTSYVTVNAVLDEPVDMGCAKGQEDPASDTDDVPSDGQAGLEDNFDGQDCYEQEGADEKASDISAKDDEVTEQPAVDNSSGATGGDDGIWIDPADYPGQKVFVNNEQVKERTMFTGSVNVRVSDSRGECYEWSKYV